MYAHFRALADNIKKIRKWENNEDPFESKLHEIWRYLKSLDLTQEGSAAEMGRIMIENKLGFDFLSKEPD